ncbi:MAG: hypothetical protein S4CHLAM6_11460 [Chlamydiae bacterium]|nr:hypothetical protein [Chlamydiota bacterium]
MNIKRQLKWLLPLLLLIIFAPWSANVDRWVSSQFFSQENLRFSNAFYHRIIFNWAVIPALATGITCGLLFILSFKFKKLFNHRFSFLFLSLSMALGAGIVTHLLFKEFCFRPRPVQTTLFGGIETFRPFYMLKFNFPNFCKSFPSGHATMGFYFVNFILLGYRLNSKLLKQVGVYATIIMSSILAFSRIAKGGHFLSDVLMSLVVTWYAALVVEKLVFDFLAKNKALSYIEE